MLLAGLFWKRILLFLILLLCYGKDYGMLLFQKRSKFVYGRLLLIFFLLEDDLVNVVLILILIVLFVMKKLRPLFMH